MKMKNVIIGIFGLALIICIGTWIYFVSGISSVTPEIKRYEYTGSVNQLISGIKKCTSANPNLNFRVIDSLGYNQKGYVMYVNIELIWNMQNIEYNLAWKKNNENGQKHKVDIHLVGAYNRTNNIGGYRKEAYGVKPLVNIFDIEFINVLKTKYDIKIDPN